MQTVVLLWFGGVFFLDDETKAQKRDFHRSTPLIDTETGAQATVLKSLDFYNKERWWVSTLKRQKPPFTVTRCDGVIDVLEPLFRCPQ